MSKKWRISVLGSHNFSTAISMIAIKPITIIVLWSVLSFMTTKVFTTFVKAAIVYIQEPIQYVMFSLFRFYKKYLPYSQQRGLLLKGLGRLGTSYPYRLRKYSNLRFTRQCSN